MAKNPYLFYSTATDATGKALADALKISGGTKNPPRDADLIIGWGTKIEDNFSPAKGVKVLNSPNAIKGNRNKLAALMVMQKAGVNVAPFVADDKMLDEMKKAKPSVSVPCIARTCYHQGGAGFFVCLTKTHVADTLKNLRDVLGKKGYFQAYIDVKDEYRIHVFGTKIICAAKKVKRDNMEAAYVEQQVEKIKASADKKKAALDDATLKFALEQQAKKLGGADNIIKSNTRGYKFSPTDITKLNKSLAEEAVKSVAAIGLDFGAVDCVLDVDGKAWVLEVNSGPGLEGTAFDTYVTAFKKYMAAEKEIATAAVGRKEAVIGKVVTGAKTVSAAEKLRVLADLLDVADESEASAINSAAKKLFG
jgi:glutathione synthase/RimK-type ligase-like ATP-grasp enzyme